MWDGFIGKHIRRSDRNILLTNLGLLLIPLTICLMNQRYWYNFFLGPFPVEQQTLFSIKNPDTEGKYFLSIEGEKSVQTGLQEITKRVKKGTSQVVSSEVSANYLALKLGQKILIVKADGNNANTTKFQGALVNIPEDIQNKLIGKLEAENPSLKEVFLPFMLRDDNFRFGGYFGLAIGLPCLILGVWNLQNVFRRWNSPEQHPIGKKLAKFGDSPEQFAAQINSEVQPGIPNYSLGSLLITPSWLFRKKSFGLDIMKLDQVVWVYQKVTQHKRNGVHAGTTYTAVVSDRQGVSIEIPANQQRVEQVIQEIINRTPWVIAGFSEELKKLWQSDRQKIFEFVDQRRQQPY
jgi:hypothetical protein